MPDARAAAISSRRSDIREPRRRGEGRARHREPDREGDEEVEEFPIEAIQAVAEPLQGRRRDGVGLAEAPVRPRAPRGAPDRRTTALPRVSSSTRSTCSSVGGSLEQVGGAIADRGCREVPEHEVRALPAEPVDEPGHRLRARPRPEGDDDVRAVRRASGSSARATSSSPRCSASSMRRATGCAVRLRPGRPRRGCGRRPSPRVTQGLGELVEQRRLARASGHR